MQLWCFVILRISCCSVKIKLKEKLPHNRQSKEEYIPKLRWQVQLTKVYFSFQSRIFDRNVKVLQTCMYHILGVMYIWLSVYSTSAHSGFRWTRCSFSGFIPVGLLRNSSVTLLRSRKMWCCGHEQKV